VSRLLYVDGVAGAAGDMLLAALLDAGADLDHIRAGLAPLGIELELLETERAGLRCRELKVLVSSSSAESRSWTDLRDLIDAGDLPASVTDRAQAVLRRLAVAEASVHGIDLDRVHFHELGGLDTVADICGVVLALEELGVGRVVSSPLPAPRGLIQAAHGQLPLPAPATLELLRGAPLYGVDLDAELVTPTGAALLTTLAESFGPLPPLRLDAIGYGAGSRELDPFPNVVRVLVGQAVEDAGQATVSLIEANLDDLSPELVPDAAQACFAAGALDVWATPAQMKKGRPGIILSALARPAQERPVSEAILRETSTLGVRVTQVRRREIDREERTVEVSGEPVRVKLGRLNGEVINVAPEHDDCASVAARTGRSVKSVWGAAFAAAQADLGGGERNGDLT
jgi:uncharacterized protein (TIGR00299 family) protein